MVAEFSWQVRAAGPVQIVEAHGELDMAAAELLWEELEPLLCPGAVVVMECSGVSFFDSTGLRAAVKAANLAHDVGAAFALIAPSGAVMRVLELSGVTDMFTVYPDVASAVTASTSHPSR
jgi:anti-sigma B factor antagonist